MNYINVFDLSKTVSYADDVYVFQVKQRVNKINGVILLLVMNT